jgi:hypothetical protein
LNKKIQKKLTRNKLHLQKAKEIKNTKATMYIHHRLSKAGKQHLNKKNPYQGTRGTSKE